jgi:glutathione synthase/RimK-type ligase-like ATP-grasp enzyme
VARIAFITCDGLTGFAPDDEWLATELRSIGHDVHAVSWKDRRRQQRCDLQVLRSAWDVWHDETTYNEYARWLTWAKRELFLLNPPSVAAWSLNKLYLADLTIPGVRIPTTVRVQRSTSISASMREHGWSHAVLKPAIGADGDLVTMVDVQRAVELDAHGLPHSWCDWMLQEFVPGVRSRGEISLVFVAGEFAHAVLKRPSSGEWRVNSQFDPQPVELTNAAVPPDLIAAILKVVPAGWLYLRVDVVIDHDELTLLEIETGDPKLWFALAPPTATRLATAIDAALHSHHTAR